jgi:nitroreductase
LDLVEAMTTTGTCRYYRPDPVPDELLERAFAAARFAPQGANVQPVRWVVVRKATLRRALADLYAPLWRDYLADLRGRFPQLGPLPRPLADADHFATHLSDVPVILVCCVRLDRVLATDADLGRLSVVGGASVYPFVQNVCLALRAEGVGTAITTLLCRREDEVRRLLDIPGRRGHGVPCRSRLSRPALAAQAAAHARCRDGVRRAVRDAAHRARLAHSQVGSVSRVVRSSAASRSNWGPVFGSS